MEILYILCALFYIGIFAWFEIKKQYLCIYLISALYIVETIGIDMERISISIAGVKFMPLDIVIGAMIIKFLIEVLKGIKFDKEDTILCILIILIAISTVSGLNDYTFGKIAQELRAFLQFVFAFIYFKKQPKEVLTKLINIIITTGVIISIIIFIKLILVLVGIDVKYHVHKLRIVNANVAFFVATTILLQCINFKNEIKYKSTLIIQTLAVILVMHRTVWVCLAIGYFFISRNGIQQKKFIAKFLAVMILLGVIILPFSSYGREIISSLIESVTEITSENSTMDWRTESWKALLNKDYIKNSKELLIGKPFGYGYERTIILSEGREAIVNQSPHNNYVVIILRIGIVGLVIFLSLYLKIIRSILSIHINNGVRNILIAVILMQLTYYIPYTFNIQHGMILAIIVGVSKSYNNIEGAV